MTSEAAPDLTVRIAGRQFKNPLGVASGTFGFGEEYAGLTDMNSIGALFTKAVTPEPRAGNVPPRLAETPAGMINAIGLANPGLKMFLREKVPVLQSLPCPAVVNVAGSTVEDYLLVAEAMEDVDAVWGIELNVSCPNVDHGGMAFGTDPKVLESLTSAVRKVCSKPLIVKLSPNVTDIADTARAAEAAGADALSCINTLTGMKVDIRNKRPVIPRGTGGLSGPAIRPVGVAATWKVSHAVKIPVIGLGGISSAEDALEYLLAGASSIQVGTVLFSEPDAPRGILKGIREYMAEEGLKKITDMHGFF
ncbi:MAG: dihydroorotate dehydrogenase [Spirochaetaceae bacterium]|nr:dihydroorotate dehydrogenase [Spirochaetaceae bacterium]